MGVTHLHSIHSSPPSGSPYNEGTIHKLTGQLLIIDTRDLASNEHLSRPLSVGRFWCAHHWPLFQLSTEEKERR